ncbi:MAG: hypothetical protein KFF73_14140 [Cyclobacteriaceae bacterium]|nr:hypothetical protein [Cyclobacteriaceae bacterium]
MEIIIEFGKLLIPALLVLYAMYLTVKTVLDKEIAGKEVDLRIKNQEMILPLRLQAYERLTLLLERISPNNILVRLSNPNYTAGEFQRLIVKEIRDEFNHNLSQQIYISEESWTLVNKAVEDTISMINQSGSSLKEDAKAMDLTKAVFGEILQNELDSISVALSHLKKEISQFY